MPTQTEFIQKIGVSTYKKRRKISIFQMALPYLLVFPTLLLIFLTIIYPMLQTLLISVSKVNRIGKIQSVGFFGNFKAILTYDGIWAVLGQTVLWVIVTVGVAFVLAYLLALILNKKFRFRKIAYILVVLPWAAPLSIATMSWMWIFHGELGPLNQILKYFHLIQQYHQWLGTPTSAFVVVSIVGIWSNISFIVITLLAGLQSIDPELYESANLDGAGPITQFRHITWPLMKSVNSLVIVLSVFWAFNAFPIIWILTKGGPAGSTETFVTLIYKLSFVKIDFGQASALSFLTFLIMLVFSVIYFILSKGEKKSVQN
ncbi:carbohydrate ABC transporter permease [Gottfriedia acidiceleris]|uniref:Sugar ABC transporter permease n=1 Tax=Gottfriedia acidiceleris TaxID=371036 RepID=A0ABY4JS93_9BACI|nr:sugar ABC transporter permease [Gottfriedia acidiceleris]UPM55532.1 sugar ABC transporter permease [Gottfriedia acidiceleris]